MNVNVEVSTVRSGVDYRATVRDTADRLVGRYRLMLTDDAMVWITTVDYALGLYKLARFGDVLSPVTVRKFFIDSMVDSVEAV